MGIFPWSRAKAAQITHYKGVRQVRRGGTGKDYNEPEAPARHFDVSRLPVAHNLLGKINMPSRLIAMVAFVALTASSSSSGGAEPVKKVLYIGIDGTRFDALEKAETSNLDGLIKDGIQSPTCLILGSRYQKNDTISGPGWSSILTGVWADKHGVHDNSFRGAKYDQFPHFFARVKECRPDAKTVSLVTWEPIHGKITSAADRSENYEQKEHGILDYDHYDTAATDEAVKQLAEGNPDVLFLYFGQVDVAGHAKGFHPTVPEYIAAIERVDKQIGRVLAALKARPTFAQEDWLVVVTSDHGGKGTGHGGGHTTPEILHSFLIVSGPAAKRGTFEEQVYLVDAPATVLAHLGVPLKPEWQLDGRPVGLK
jgi:predicted AlkP superfamily pyrophosphatase or phosphodiesterase